MNSRRFLAIYLIVAMLTALLPFGVFTASAIAGDDNLLSGKTVNISGNGVGAWDEDTEGSFKYRANLTDGKIADGMNWMITNGSASITAITHP